GFLHIDEYPPDANQGFDLPSALISFPGFKTSTIYHEQKLSAESPLLHKLQRCGRVTAALSFLLRRGEEEAEELLGCNGRGYRVRARAARVTEEKERNRNQAARGHRRGQRWRRKSVEGGEEEKSRGDGGGGGEEGDGGGGGGEGDASRARGRRGRAVLSVPRVSLEQTGTKNSFIPTFSCPSCPPCPLSDV
ncbi:hypothetical protein EJ110_NYTH58183, partial [Nymphaea thermarum]